MLNGAGSVSPAKPSNTDSLTTLGAKDKPKANPDVAESNAMLQAGQATLMCVLSQPNAGNCISTAGLGAAPSFGTPAQPATAGPGEGNKADKEAGASGGMKVNVGEDSKKAEDKKLLEEFQAFKAAQEDTNEAAEEPAVKTE